MNPAPAWLRTRTARDLGLSVLAIAAGFALDGRASGFRRSPAHPVLNACFDLLSKLRGGIGFLPLGLLVLVAALLLRNRRWIEVGKRVVLAVVLSGIAVLVLKPLLAQPGPGGMDSTDAGASWLERRWGRLPSGHTAPMFAAGAALAGVLPPAVPVVYALGTCVAVERVYSGIHYPSDCVVGAVLGIFIGRAVARRRRNWDRSRGASMAPSHGTARAPDVTARRDADHGAAGNAHRSAAASNVVEG